MAWLCRTSNEHSIRWRAPPPGSTNWSTAGLRISLVYFEEGGWICFDSLDPDGIYADWDAFEPALSELIDAVFNPA